MAAAGRARPLAVLLDLDGTLVDSRAPYVHCLAGALREAGVVPPGDEALHRFLGPPIEETLEGLLGLPRDAPEVLAIREDFRTRYREEGGALTTVFPDVPEALDALAAAGHVLALATSKSRPVAEAVVEATGLREHLAHLGAADPDAIAEPKATTIARVLGELGTREATMVGDRRHDVEAARVHGLRAVGVLWWDNPHADELDAFDATARSPLELPALVRP